MSKHDDQVSLSDMLSHARETDDLPPLIRVLKKILNEKA